MVVASTRQARTRNNTETCNKSTEQIRSVARRNEDGNSTNIRRFAN